MPTPPSINTSPPSAARMVLSRLAGTLQRFFRTQGGLDIPDISTPAETPTTGRRLLYVKPGDNLLYAKTAEGVESAVTASAQAAANAAQSAAIPNGRLFVPAAYYQTNGAGFQAVDGSDDQASFSWLQETDMALTSVSVYVGAVTTPGNLNFALKLDSAGVPGSLIADLGAVDSGAAAGWVRLTFAAQQLYRNTRYHLVITGTAGKSYGLAYRRGSTTIGSGFPSDAISLTAINGASSWTALHQDDPAMAANFLVVLNSTANHSPSIWYGQFNGQNLYIPGTGLMMIPQVGISLNCQALTVNTVHCVYIYNASGTLALEGVTTVPAESNGILVKTGTIDHVFLGLIYTKAGPGGAVGPIDCADHRGVANAYNKIFKSIGKCQLYTAATSYTIGNAWTPWNNGDDWKVWVLSWDSAVDMVAACSHTPPSGQSMLLGIAVDSVNPSAQCAGGNAMGALNFSVTSFLKTRFDNGLHYLVPISWCSSSGGSWWGWSFGSNLSSFRGVVLI